MSFLAAVSGSCGLNEPATEVMLVIEARGKAQELGVELQVDIEGRSANGEFDGMPISRSFHPKEPLAPTWPLELAITPRGGDAQRTFLVTATLLNGSGEAIAVQRARSGFVSKRTLALHLVFADDCFDPSLDCGESETCLLGSCVDAFIDPNELAGWPDSTVGSNLAADGGAADTSSMEPALSSTATGGKGSKAAAGSGGSAKPNDKGPSQGAGDMSQPDGAAPQTDKPGDCGDGVINPGEKCDTGIAEGQKGSCPTACPAEDACRPATLEGDGCQSQCVAYAITTADSGDGCCPPAADAKDDTDCGALCGNGVQEAGEKCDPIEMCPTLDKCQKADACLRATIVGDAAQCNAECVMEPIAECVSGDGCCPESCTHADDNDCSSSCGDGTVDRLAGELCEPGSATMPCPTTCTDADPCTSDLLLGSEKNCNRVCTHVPIVVPIPGDGCCPSGANANSDFDCRAMCGNGIVELGERCDGRCPKAAADCEDGDPCTRDAVEGTGCDAHCVHPRINTAAAGDKCCPRGANANNDSDCQPLCGNTVKEGGEECDGDCPRCDDGQACTRDFRAVDCKLACTTEPITAAISGDGCCPTGATSATDHDCMDVPPPVTCPNGKPDPGEICDGNCPESCDDMVDCTKDTKTGTPAACNVKCSHEPITSPANGDSCCPSGENSATDSDCKNPPPPTCPNGEPDPGETCDGDCPTSCSPSADPCTENVLTGSAATCDVKCVPTAVTKKAPDGCCVKGETKVDDPACEAVCGNRVTEPGEKCDMDCEPCTTTVACKRAVAGGSDPCNPTCTLEDITAPADGDRCCPGGLDEYQDSDCRPRCGNNHVETGEECDSVSETCLNCKTVTAPPPDPPVAGAEARAL